ncbi:MAG: TonB-dependent receptor [Tannerellaceae bacterium]|nr:TonB-dependent receptor [Tannerellaceae bacterium]
MKNKSLSGEYYAKNPGLEKILHIMRITTFLLLVCVICSNAESLRSQNARVNLNKTKAALREVLTEIEEQTDYLFIYNNQVNTNRMVSVKAKNQPVAHVLHSLLDNFDMDYKMEGSHIILTNKITPAVTQQTRRITGTVTDIHGEPILGANVVEKGTTNGVITDMDGHFSLDVFPAASLTISYIGYLTKEIPVTQASSYKIELIEDAQTLDEVVVIGYGVVKKSDLTGSVSGITSTQFQSQPLTRVDDILKGRVPGATVVTNSGSPDKDISVRIRGANSLYGGNDPLYIIDGVPAPTLNMNTSDIQSIEVLKDASATAIYGSRGANGVVLVTTKRGAQGKTNIVLETNSSWSHQAKKYDMLSAADFAESVNEWRGNETFTSSQIADFRAGRAGTDWQDLIFRTAYSQNHKLSISGGLDKVRYFISGNFEDNQGILIESSMRRYAVRSNIQADATDWLTVDLDINAYNKKRSGLNGQTGSIGSPLSDALTYSPTTNLRDENGDWGKDNIVNLMANPYGRLVQNPNDAESTGATANLQLTFRLPVKGLSIHIQGAATYTSDKSFYLNSKLYGLSATNEAGNSRSDSWDLYSLNQINYTNQWGGHRLTAMVAGEFTQWTGNGLSGTGSELLTESVGYWNLGMGTTLRTSNWYSQSSLASVFGRAMYSFNDRYFATATVRRDGSSKFQGSNRWGNFPSVSVAWRASEESFIKSLHIFDNLKLRASWGVTGNQGINAYGTLGLLADWSSTWGDYDANTLPGYTVGNPSSPDLTWEKTYQYDLGLDMGFLNNRLNISVDWYQKNTKDLLLQKPIPLYDGGGTAWVNLGEVRNRGIDLQVSGVILQSKDWRWESSLNFSYNQNTVMDLGGETRISPGSMINNGASINSAVLEVGKPMGSILGYTWLGLWRTDEAAEAAKWGQQPGDNKFLDFDGDYALTAEDLTIIGKAFPDKMLGWNNTFSWKRLDVNVMFQGAFGADRLNLGRYLMNQPNSDVKWMTGAEGWFNRWTPENQDTWVPNPFSTTVNPRLESHQYLESANYVRLTNLSFSYTLPKSMIKACDLTLTVSGQNLFTITNYKGGDPETTMSSHGSGNSTSDTNAGIDGISYPQPRTFTLGARLSF